MRAYRVCFGGEEIDYKSNFKGVRDYYPVIKDIINILKFNRVENIWWFFEPYVEITWISDSDSGMEAVKEAFGTFVSNFRATIAPDVGLADWYCNSDHERRFGIQAYTASAALATEFYEYDQAIRDGKGWENQLMRRFHVLCNQLGYNYKEEGKLLIKRGVLALLFWFLGHHKAVWIYTKILRQKY